MEAYNIIAFNSSEHIRELLMKKQAEGQAQEVKAKTLPLSQSIGEAKTTVFCSMQQLYGVQYLKA